MNVEVKRMSHVHQMPQTGFAHKGPVTKTQEQKMNPTSAAECATSSQARDRLARYITLPSATMK